MRKNSFIAIALAAVILFTAITVSFAAKGKLFVPPRIGIVSIKQVFDNCSMKDEIEKSLASESEKAFAELKQLEDKIALDKSELSKRKENSSDYLDLLKEILTNQSRLEAQKEFYQQSLTVKEMQGKEKIYRKVLEVVSGVAKENGLDMVISRDDNYLNKPEDTSPAQNPTELVLTTKTHKLLYFNPDLDITEQVLAEMDK